MKHIKTLSRVPALATTGTTTNTSSPIEELIVLLFTAFFRNWDNFSSVIQNLQKYYGKL